MSSMALTCNDNDQKQVSSLFMYNVYLHAVMNGNQ